MKKRGKDQGPEKGQVRVFLAKTLEEARQVSLLLAREGIRVSMFGHNLLRLPKWFGGPSDGSVKIFVSEEDESRAREILRGRV